MSDATATDNGLAPDLEPAPPPPAPPDLPSAPQPGAAGRAAPEAQPLSLTAYRAQRAGVAPEQASQALALSAKTGLAPQFVADNLDTVRQADEQRLLTQALAGMPVVADWMSQSAVHAAAAKDSIGPLQALTMGLADVGYGGLATSEMSFPTAGGEAALQGYEAEAADYDKRPSGWSADLLRSAPSLAVYYLAGALGKAAGREPGQFAATAGMMYALNRGVLYRQIMHQMPIEESGETPDPAEYEKQARLYATVGATASAAVGAGLSTAISLAMPGAAAKIQRISTGIVAKAFTDPATRAVIGRLITIGGHTLSGALMMAAPAVVDDAAVQKAVTGQIDVGEAATHGWEAFKRSILAAGVLSTLPHAVGLVKDLGRINQAPADAARLDHLVESAKALKLPPAQAQPLIGKMAEQGDISHAYIDGEAASDPEVAAKLVETLADEGQALAEAHATSGDVAVPIEKYLVQLGDQHEALKDNVKLSADGMTPRQAREWQEAWHGTPHQFAEFDLSRVGTGEGAQSYGHGLYFAEAHAVAGTYRGTPTVAVPGLADSFAARRANEYIGDAVDRLAVPGKDTIDTAAVLTKATEHAKEELSLRPPADPHRELVQQAVAHLESLTPKDIKVGFGRVYRAAIPQSDALLDFDKPLAEQHPHVLAALEAAGILPHGTAEHINKYQALSRQLDEINFLPAAQHTAETTARYDALMVERSAQAELGGFLGGLPLPNGERMSPFTAHGGDHLYKSMAESGRSLDDNGNLLNLGTQGASDRLRAAGIPGLKYLDQGSRTAGEGTHNFVIWDNRAIRMLAPGEPVNPPAPESKPLPGTMLGGRAATEWAAQLLDDKPIEEIQPGRFALAARTAEDKLAATAKEGAQAGTEAARRGFLGAGMEQQESAAPGAGKENLRKAGVTADMAQRRLDKLPMLERARDLARAMAEQATVVRAEMDAARSYIESRDTPEHRTTLAKADPAYLGAFDALADAIDDNTPRAPANPGALDALLARMKKRDAEPVGFNESALRDLLTDPKGWKKLTPPEARNVLDAVKNIREAARRVNEISVGDRQASLRDVVASATAETASAPDIQPVKYTAGNPRPLLARLRAGLNDWNAKLLQFKRQAEDLGATVKTVLYDGMKEAMHYRDQLARDAAEFYRRNFEQMPKEIRARASEETDVSADLPLPEGLAPLSAVPRTYLYMLRLHDGSGGNMDRVLGGYGWTQEAVDRVLYENPKTRLAQPEMDFLQSLHDYNDKTLWPLAKAKQERVTGAAPPKVPGVARTFGFEDGTIKRYEGGYWPLREDRGTSAEHAQVDAPGTGGLADFYGNNYERATIYNPSMKERAVTARYPVDLSWSTAPAHISQVIHDIAMDEYTRNAGRLITDPEFKALAERKLGQGRADELPLQLRRIATRQADSVAAEAGIPFRALQYIRGTAIMAVIGDAIPMAMGQLSHIPGMLTGGKVSPLHGTFALITMFKPLGFDADGMHFFPNWQDALHESGELQHRDLNSTRRIAESVANLPKATRPLEIARTTAGIFLHLVDRYTSTWAYIASKNEGLAKRMSEEAAIKYANGVVEDIMPTHDIETAAPLLTNRTIGATLMMHGFGSTLYNLGYKSVIRPVTSAWSAGERGQAVKLAALRGAQYLAMTSVLSVAGQGLFGHGPEEDESFGAWLLRTAISGWFYPLPWLGGVGEMAGAAVANATMERASGHMPRFSVRQAPSLALLQRAQDLVGTLASDNKEPSDKFFAVLEGALAACRVPSRPVRSAKYLYDLQQGNVEARGPGDVIGGVLYGQHPKQGKNIPVKLQDLLSGD